MNRTVIWKLLIATMLLLCLAALAPATNKGTPRDPSLFEKVFQSSQIAAPFPVDLEVARQWVPPAFELAVDATGKATGVLALLHSAEYCLYRTPNSPPLEEGENFAPESVVHFWFAVKGPAEVLPVPGAQVTSATSYFYDVADLVTSPDALRLYRRAGRPAILVRDISFVDEETTQSSEMTFLDGSKITLTAIAPAPYPSPLKVGGNAWQWHVGGLGEMGNDLGVRLDPATGNPSNINTTRVQFLGLVPGPPNSTQVTIQADPGTVFEDCYGMTYAVSSRATYLKLNNLALNASRGDLAWTTYPPFSIPVPPAFPIP